MSDSRLEKFIYAICSMDVSDLPVPLSRIEKLWNCLITGETPDFEPLSRNEKYLMAMLDRYDISNLPAPMSRGEKLLYKIAMGETDLSDVPGYLSRYEELLKYLIENGGIGGGDFEYVLYTLNQSLYTLYTTAEKPVKKAIIYGDTLANTLQESSSLAATPMGEDINAQQATITGTANGVIKSVILKGQTLVNLFQDMDYVWNNLTKQDSFNYNGDLIILNNGYRDGRYWDSVPKIPNIKSNTEYTMIFTKGSSPYVEFGTIDENGQTSALKRFTNAQKLKITSPNNGDLRVKFCIENPASDKSAINLGKVMFIEGDYTNVDIPYFEGMQSVKMPVLTTTGKNLFDIKNIDKIYQSTNNVTNQYKIRLKPNTNYTMSSNVPRTATANIYFNGSATDVNGVYINAPKTVMSDNDGNLFFYIRVNDLTGIKLENFINNDYYIQLEEGSNATSYEPFKSNILSTTEDVTLRGIGNVQDTLDCLTGEVTQRIGEIVLDGSESWIRDIASTLQKTTISAYVLQIIDTNQTNSTDIICSRFQSKNINMLDEEGIYIHGSKGFRLKISIDKLSSPDINGFKTYLQSNPITVQYQLSTESIKTVDLTVVDQDGNIVPHLQAFNETTHITTSSTGLIPNVVIPATVSYLSIIKPSTLYTVKLKRSVTSGSLMINVGGTEQAVTSDCFTLTTPSTLTSQDVIFSGKGNVISEVTVVEGDQTSKEYGYFEGMQSVKMPVLTTIGKNLLNNQNNSKDTTIEQNGIVKTYAGRTLSDYVKVSKSRQYTFSGNGHSGEFVAFFDNSKTFIERIATSTFTPKQDGYIRVFQFASVEALYQIEEDSVATEYEPYKSNILTVNEEVELRGIGEVQDTLDLMTGELTQRIGEIVLDGSEEWQKNNTDVISFYYRHNESLLFSKIITDNYPIINSFEDKTNGIFKGGSAFGIIKNDIENVEQLKQWLSQNPITVQYQLATESIKTVDLTTVDQDNQPTKLGTFENVTHVSLEAENLIPEVEMEVATNLLEDTVFNLTNAFNTLYPTAAKPVKSAILKGQTVNCLLSLKNITAHASTHRYTRPLNVGETYTIFYNYTVTGTDMNIVIGEARAGDSSNGIIGTAVNNGKITEGTHIGKKVVTLTEISSRMLASWIRSGTGTLTVNELYCIEGDYSNVDIPFVSTGLQSVKMPVLKATGKNLFDFESFKKEENRIWGSKSYSSFKLNLKPNTKYSWNRFSNDGFGSTCYVLINTVLGSSANALNWLIHSDSEVINHSKGTFNTDNTGVVYISGIIKNDNQEKTFELLENLIIIESGTSPVSYEPYKSNILTVNEEVELRGIGDVQDTLDCLTGELTQRIGEIVLDGSKNWILNDTKTNTNVFRLPYSKLIRDDNHILCDKLPVAASGDVEKIASSGQAFYVALSKTKANTLSDFKSYLSKNPLTVQYELATPTTKTVDLSIVNQDGNETKLRTFDDTTHVLLESEGLIPTAALTVRTKIPSASSTSLLMNDISTEQQQLNTTVDEQSENVDATMIATTEIFEDTL